MELNLLMDTQYFTEIRGIHNLYGKGKACACIVDFINLVQRTKSKEV